MRRSAHSADILHAMSDLPARPIDRQALERVLGRAAELQAASPDSSDAPDVMSEQQLIDLGKEVGLAPEHLRRALAEERTRVALPVEERGLTARLLGVAMVQASRDVDGTAADILPLIDTWMQQEEALIVKRHHPDRVVWEPHRGFTGNIRRALNVGGRGYALANAGEIAATFTAVGEGRTRVSLDADLSTRRERLGWTAATLSLGGVASTGILMVLPFAAPVAIIPMLVIPPLGVYAVRQTQMRAAMRAQLALEQLLDRLERGELARPQSLIGAISAVAAAAAAPATPRKR